MKNSYLPHIALLSANIMYGLNFNIAKGIMPEYIGPFGFIFCRVLGALSLFWLVQLFIKSTSIEKKDFPRLIVCGLFGVAMNQLMFFYGLNITSPINASVIMTITPILVLVFAALIIRERITRVKILGIILGITGALALILYNMSSPTLSSSIGDFFIFMNAASYSVYLVLVKPLLKKYNPLSIIKWVFTFGFLFVIPFGVDEFKAVDWSTFKLSAWASFLYVIIGVSFLAYLFNIYALKKLNPSAVSIYIYIQPLTATIFALVLGNGELNTIKVLAALLIFTGVFMVNSSSLRKNAQ